MSRTEKLSDGGPRYEKPKNENQNKQSGDDPNTKNIHFINNPIRD